MLILGWPALSNSSNLSFSSLGRLAIKERSVKRQKLAQPKLNLILRKYRSFIKLHVVL